MNNKDFMIKEPLYKVILYISFPLMLNALVMTFYDLTDSFWLGRLGYEYFASVSFVWPVLFLFISIGLSLSIASTSVISQLLGAKRFKDAGLYATHILYVFLFSAIFFMIIGYVFSPNIVNIMGGSGKFAKNSTIYLRIDAFAYPFILGFLFISSLFNAQGKTKISLYINAISVFVNVIIDPIFIFDKVPFLNINGLGLGVSGAAFATLVSKFLLFILAVIVFYKSEKPFNFRFKDKVNYSIILSILSIAIPAVIGQGGTAIGFMVLNSVLASYGTVTIAAFGMVNRATSFLMMPATGIGNSLTAIVGQNIGAKKPDRVKEAFKKGIIMSLLISSVGAIIVYVFDKDIIEFFVGRTKEKELITQASEYIGYLFITIPTMGLFNVFHGFFQGCGYTEYGMYLSLTRLWILRLPMIFTFKYFTDFGPSGVWFSVAFSNVVIILVGFIFYFRGRWKKPKIKRNVLELEA